MQHHFNIEFNNTHLQVIMNQEPRKDELLRLRDEKRGKTTRKLRFLLNVSSVSQSSSKNTKQDYMDVHAVSYTKCEKVFLMHPSKH